MTLCMFHNEGIFSNKFSEFEVFASRQSAFLISEFLHVSSRVPDLPKICNIWDTLRSIISRVSQISRILKHLGHGRKSKKLPYRLSGVESLPFGSVPGETARPDKTSPGRTAREALLIREPLRIARGEARRRSCLPRGEGSLRG